jgi:hypothetical protein
MADPIYDPSKEVLARGRDGHVRRVALDQVDQVAASGGTVLSPEESQAAQSKAARYAETQTVSGQVGTFLAAGASGVLAAPAAMAGTTGERAFADILSLGEADPWASTRYFKDIQRHAEANPTLQFLGSTIGTTATAMAGGMGVAGAGGKLATALGSEAAAASLASGGGLLGRAAATAITRAPTAAGFLTENAAAGVGTSNEQAFLDDRELAADEVAAAGGIGAALGLGLGLGARGAEFVGRKAAQKVARSLPAGGLDAIAEKAAFRAVDQGAPKVGALKRIKNEADARLIGRRMLDEDIPLNDPAQALAAIEDRLTVHGDTFNRVGEAASEHVDPAWLYEKIKTQADKIRATSGTKANAALADKVEGELMPTIERMARGEPVDFEFLKQARTQLRDESRNLKGASRKAYDELNRTLTESLDEAVTKADVKAGTGGQMFKDWKAANRAYRELSTAKEAYTGKVAAEAQQRIRGGFGDQLLGGQAAALGSVLTGNVGAGALIGLGTAAARKVLREKAPGWIAQAANHMAKRGEIPSVTKLLAASSTARRELGGFAVRQMVQKGARMASETEAPAGFGYGALANYADPKAVGEQYAAAESYLRGAQGDPEGMATRTTEHFGSLSHEQPELATAAQMKAARAVDYLRDTQPIAPPTTILGGKQRPPQRHEMTAWLRRFRATVDPSVIYGEVARGRVTAETVETLETLYPAYYATVREGVFDTLNRDPSLIPSLSYSQRLSLDTLAGGRGLVEPTRSLSVQERLAQANAEMTGAASPSGGPAGNPTSNKAPQIAQSLVTTSGRLQTST